MHAETIDEVSDWYTGTGAGYEMLLRADKGDGPVASVSTTDISGFELRVFNWGIPVHGLLVADTSTITINTALTGTRNVRDQHFGNISWERNQAGIYSLEAGTEIASNKPHSLLHLVLPVKLLEARARSFFDREPDEPLRFSPVVDLSREGKAVNSLFDYLLVQAVTAPDALRYPAVESSLRELIISTVLGTLPNNYEQRSSSKVDCTVPRSVKRAEEYMRAHADEPISVELLARNAGCSERALQNAFKTFRGTTPMGMLRDIRLEKAYRDMKEATGTIAEIAFKWGFSNLGRFSAQYAAKFGETPSQTRKFC
ncbi:AraC family transcriptional regulator [Hoeflea prorocentri]|uniref:AraC family transcriptional regulator n=1 Tax=Hoeflea prorocentri TaxID=1922333 RepID=A0A9X3UKW1_9HYPH|nr:AraC family transcriptional regulator [Hoeflea prorocentri]MCY6382432.1 AraC family transcriptional regulator [Hoeflea prorocentri]MDA5400232.1 AraC family transcriptional regulator [Hoeflea prorocentri]